MSFLDGLFVCTVEGDPDLEIAEVPITASAEIDAGFLYLVEGSDSDITLTVAGETISTIVGQRIGVKVIEPAPTPPGGALSVAVPVGMLIEDDSGAMVAETTLEGGQELGTYREWLLDISGNWILVAGGSGGGAAAAHAVTHEAGGDDQISVAGLSGVLADDQRANALREPSGPTLLTAGAIPTLTLLRRSGSALEGCVPGDFAHAAPTTAAKLLIDDGGVIRHCTIAELLALATAARVYGPPYVGLLQPPASPDAWSDELDTGSDDVAARGWTIQVTGTGAVPTRAGPFDPSVAVAAGTYRSSIIGGKLCLQIANPVFISKPLSASCALAARVSAFGQAAGIAWGVGISSTQQHTNGSNSFFFGWNRADQAFLLSYFAGGYSGQGTVASIHQYDAYNIQWFNFALSGVNLTSAQILHISEYSGVIASLSSTYAGSFGGFSPVYGGLFLTDGPRWFEIDYIRKYPANGFFPT